MTGPTRSTIASGAAALATAVALFPLTRDRTFVLLAAVLIATSAAIAVGARRLGAHEVVVRVLQLLGAVLVPLLVPETSRPGELYQTTVAYLRTEVAPMPYQVGFAVFSAALLWLVYLLCETLCTGLDSPAWTFPPLILTQLITTLAIPQEASVIGFAFAAGGYVLLLATSVRNRVAGPARTVTGGLSRSILVSAALAALLAIAGTAVFSASLAENGRASNSGSNAGVQLNDPSLDLIRNVNAASDQVVITYRTSTGEGTYLRLAALPKLDDSGFHLVGTQLQPAPIKDGQLDGTTTTIQADVTVGDFASQWLPLPWSPVSYQADGDWRYDPGTLAVVAVGAEPNTATRNLSYHATAKVLVGVDEQVRHADAGTVDDDGQTLSVPSGIDQRVWDLATRETSGAKTGGEKVLKLRNFLTSGAFTYSTQVAPGTSLGTLNDFLLDGRTGYCEQFAGALAVMARIAGVPSRVVVGFLPGHKVDDQWRVSLRNMHAWVEVYLNGLGWVALDATPGGAAGSPTTSATPSQSASVSPSTSAQATATARPTSSGAPVLPPKTDHADTQPWPLAGAAAAVLVLAIAVAPATVRRLQRTWRLRSSPDNRARTEAAWAEAKASVIDAGGNWPPGAPNRIAGGLDTAWGTGAAFAELAALLERARYAEVPEPAERAKELTLAVIAGVAARRQDLRRVDRWWPRSMRFTPGSRSRPK